MTVTKYSSVADMPPLPRAMGADLAKRIRRVWARGRRFGRFRCTPGLQKFTNIEAAQQARAVEVKIAMQELRKQRRREVTSER